MLGPPVRQSRSDETIWEWTPVIAPTLSPLSVVSLYGVLDRLSWIRNGFPAASLMLQSYAGKAAFEDKVGSELSIAPMDLSFDRCPPQLFSRRLPRTPWPNQPAFAWNGSRPRSILRRASFMRAKATAFSIGPGRAGGPSNSKPMCSSSWGSTEPSPSGEPPPARRRSAGPGC